MAKTLTVEEHAAELEAANEQLEGQVAILTQRNGELAGYEQECRALRDANSGLEGKLADASLDAEAARREANLAAGRAASASAAASSDAGLVDAARQIAAGLKVLLGK